MHPVASPETGEVIRRFIDALGRADVDGVLAEVSDTFELAIHTAPKGVPPTVAGKEQLAALVASIELTWTDLRVPVIEVHPLADDPARALAEYDVVATNHDGSEYRNRYVAIGTVTDGLITRFHEYYDPAPMVAAIAALRLRLRRP